jgi:bifunctional DNA-binding transcriptional regulator/antitoxin component of YhaV-PrlF toxin-antitoxin module
MNAVVKVDETGKLEIPADLMNKLGFKQEEKLVIIKANVAENMEMIILPKYQPSRLTVKKLTLELEYDPETHQYIAACPELDLATAGDGEEAAVEDLVEAMEEYAQDYLERLDLFASSPNRGAHLPLILSVASCSSKAEIQELLSVKRIG